MFTFTSDWLLQISVKNLTNQKSVSIKNNVEYLNHVELKKIALMYN